MRTLRLVIFTHRAHEADALSKVRLNETLLVAAIANGAPGGIDPRRQGGIRHEAAMPDCGKQVVFTDDAVTVLNQVGQKVEHLRFDGERSRSATQFSTVRIEREILE